MRDPSKLRAFQLADELAVAVYRATKRFPRDEQFSLTSQMRRAAVSTASNIVEGCARSSQADYVHFLGTAYGSASELLYQLSLASRLGYFQDGEYPALKEACAETCRVLNGLIRSLRH